MDDWRLSGQERYLSRAVLIKAVFKKHSEIDDHTHCIFCWDKFSERAEDLHVGYTNGYHWICETCFNDFKEQFGWIVTKGRLADR